MGISSDGQICYGIAFEEGYTFPWSGVDYDGEFETWWIVGVCGYENPFEIYTSQGEYINGVRPEQDKMDEYYKHYREFKEANPMPISVVSHCSYDYAMHIIAVPDTYMSNSRGFAEIININKVGLEKEKTVIDFCEKYLKPDSEYCEFPEMKLNWLLTSMYG